MRRLAGLVGLVALLSAPIAEAVPTYVGHQGRLIDSLGAPLDGAHQVQFALYDAASGGRVVWSETIETVVSDGYYAVFLGGTTPINAATLTGGGLYLSIAVDGAPELTPRVPISSVPYAIWSEKADLATNLAAGAVIDASEIRVNGTTVIDSSGAVSAPVSWDDIQDVPADVANAGPLATLLCVEGQQPTVVSGLWTCTDVNAHTHSAADITAGVLDINRLPVGGSAGTVAAGDHTHPYTELTGRPTTLSDLVSACSAGQVAKWSGSAWACAVDDGLGNELDPSVNALGKATLSCSSGQVAKWNGTAWACAADAGLTSELDPSVNALGKATLSCSSGQVAKWNGSIWACAADAGLTVESDPTVNVLAKASLPCSNGQVPKWNGSAWTCSADAGLTVESDPSVNALGKATLSCSSGQVAKWNGSIWACAADAGLTAESDPSVNALGKATLSCSSGQVAKWNGTAWACAADAGLTAESDPSVNALGKATLSCSSGQYASWNGSAWVCATLPAYSPITTYTRWGRTVCPSDATAVYTGWMAHGHYTHGGGPVNYMCLHDSPQYNQVNSGNQNGALLYKVEFEMSGYGLSSLNGLHDRDARCVVCEIPRRTTIMIGARRDCPSGWTREYEGYLMGQHYTQAASELICVDAAPEAHGGSGSENGGLLYPTEFENGGNVPYNHDWEMTCTVCSK